MKLKEAYSIVGSISTPTKMPGYSWGISPRYCKTGKENRRRFNSVCSYCYAQVGWYPKKTVRDAQEVRYKGLLHPQWTEAMILILSSVPVKREPFFRWFDSGDLQGTEHFLKICKIASSTPFLNHWLPTKEFATVRQAEASIPSNLIVRFSGLFVDGSLPDWPYTWPYTSTVIRHTSPVGYECPATKENYFCGECRACWDKNIPNISLHWHSNKEAKNQLSFSFQGQP